MAAGIIQPMSGFGLGRRRGSKTTTTQKSPYVDLVSGFQEREAAARAANIKREQEIRGIYGDIIGQYEEGGAFREAGLADIERTRTRAIGAGTQQMISSGLYGTTTAAAIPVQAEAGARQARLRLEDVLEQRTTEAKKGLASFAERIETPYPDYGLLVQAMMAQATQQPADVSASGAWTRSAGGRRK